MNNIQANAMLTKHRNLKGIERIENKLLWECKANKQSFWRVGIKSSSSYSF
jgi:hypothetical protein